jgi:hypothetical protein
MNDLQLPLHVINRLERRWAARLERDATIWRDDQSIRPLRRILQDGKRQIPVTVKRTAVPRRAAPASPNA